MINLDGLEKVINLLGNKNILLTSFIFSIMAVIFFIPELLAFVRIPKILVENGEWFRLGGCFSFVVLGVNLIILVFNKINISLQKMKNKKQLLKDLLSLTTTEKEILTKLYNYEHNKFNVDNLAIIELQRKKIIYIPATFGNHTKGESLYTMSGPVILFPFAITPDALALIKKEKLKL